MTTFVCYVCCKPATQKVHLAAHFRTQHSEEQSFKCPFCGTCCTSSFELKVHEKTSCLVFSSERKKCADGRPIDGNWQCQICDRYCKDLQSLRMHMRSVHPIKTKSCQCDECCKCFPSVQVLQKHIRACHVLERFQCDECGRRTTSRSGVALHLTAVHGKVHKLSTVYCYECEQAFPALADLKKRHLRDHHPTRQVFTCDKCQRKWFYSQSLKNHSCHLRGEAEKENSIFQINGVETLFKCDVCCKIFSGRGKLVLHSANVHASTALRPFPGSDRVRRTDGGRSLVQCAKCVAWFRSGKDLQRHERRHEIAAVNLRCRFCGHTSPDRVTLHRHERICNASVSSASVQLACSRCERTVFRNADQLRRHVKIVHGSVTAAFQCDICDKVCKEKTGIISHHAANVHLSTLRPMNAGGSRIIRQPPYDAANSVIKVQGGREVLQCSKCVKTFTTAYNLRKHDLLQHMNKTCAFPCSTCSRTFASIVGLNYHEESTHGTIADRIAKDRDLRRGEVAVFECDLCGVAGKQRGNLSRHLFFGHRMRF